MVTQPEKEQPTEGLNVYTRQGSPQYIAPHILFGNIPYCSDNKVLSILPSVKWPFGGRPMQMIWVELPRGTKG